MEYRLLGNTGIKISEIAFGGVGIGLPYADQSQPSKDMSLRLLTDAFDQGINFYDTARQYGDSEELIGEAFVHKRDEVVIATKASHLLQPGGRLPAPDVVRSMIRRSLEKSLTALQTDYVDIFMLHQAHKEILECETVQTVFEELKKEGLVRFAGVSTYKPSESKFCIDSDVWDVIQMPGNLLDQRHLRLLDQAEKRGKGVIIRSVLFRGMLTGRHKNLHPDLKDVESHIDILRKWNKNYYSDLLTLAVRFVLSFPDVSAALIGMDKPAHLEKAIEVAKAKRLNEKIRFQLEEMAFENAELLNLNTWVKRGWLKS